MSSLSSCTQPSLTMFSAAPSGGGNGGNEIRPGNTLGVTMTPPISTKFAHNQRVAVCANGGGRGDKGKNDTNTCCKIV